jgi:hypothetical protein
MTKSSEQHWQPLSLLASQFQANVAAVATRYPDLARALLELPATTKRLSTASGQLRLGERVDGTVRAINDPAPPASARQIVAKVYPTGQCTFPLVVAGLGYGWIWQQLYALPISTPALPGHRPPLYFMASDVAHLHTILHLHDWRTMLADERVRLFAGADAYAQLERSLTSTTRLPWPKLAVTVEPACWPATKSIDGLVQSLFAQGGARLTELQERHRTDSAESLAAKLERGDTLRILGVTSRYTTFLQHSMRDWLDAFARLGHATRLMIEDADHEVLNNIEHAQACAEFRPDLIVLIDHYRGEFGSFPPHVPCVMWVQDSLPNIFNPKAGAAQTERDYCLGFGRLALSEKHGYPAQRFMPATVGVNHARFAPEPLTPAEIDAYGCDVAFVSHASVPAESIIAEQLAAMPADGHPLIRDVFDRLRAIYDAGGSLTQPILLRRMIEQSAAATGTSVDGASMPGLIDFFHLRVNNALFRHQSLQWLADSGVDLRLYGRGWESHPMLGRFARGIADNQTQLSAIYRASRINLQITPHGAVHQRLMEGLSAGGFYLIRHCPGDEIERVYKSLYAWCVANGIDDDDAIRRHRGMPQVQQWLAQAESLLGIDPFEHDYALFDALRLSADGEYIRSAATVWPEYDAVAYRTEAELTERVARYLADEPARRAIAASMRACVLERFTYVGTTRRLLRFIADDLATQQQTPSMEAAA